MASMTEKSSIPLIWAAALMMQTAGGVAWITTLQSDVAQAKSAISEQKTELKEQGNDLNILKRAIVRVQTKMGIEVPENER
jgi:hypothetical protein